MRIGSPVFSSLALYDDMLPCTYSTGALLTHILAMKVMFSDFSEILYTNT